MITLRDKINRAVDEARNCRRLSYAALDLLEDLFERELFDRMSSGMSRKSSERVYVVEFSSTGSDFRSDVDIYATRDAASKAVIREAKKFAKIIGLQFDAPDLQIKRALRNGQYSIFSRGAIYSWQLSAKKVKT
jgi:hypothetical protein